MSSAKLERYLLFLAENVSPKMLPPMYSSTEAVPIPRILHDASEYAFMYASISGAVEAIIPCAFFRSSDSLVRPPEGDM